MGNAYAGKFSSSVHVLVRTGCVESDRSAKSTAVSSVSFGASFGFHATMNLTEAEATSYPFSFHSVSSACIFCDSFATGLPSILYNLPYYYKR